MRAEVTARMGISGLVIRLLCALVDAKSLRLLYRWSVDGSGVAKFHDKCAHKGPTLVFAQLPDGHFFGGFTSLSWSSKDSEGRSDASAFLFTINQDGEVEEYLQTGEEPDEAVHQDKYGPCFGAENLEILLNDPPEAYFGLTPTYQHLPLEDGELRDVWVFSPVFNF